MNKIVKMGKKIMSGLALLAVVASATSVMAGSREDQAVAVTVYKQVSREGVIYTYSVTNHSKYPVVSVWIGYDNYNDTPDLSGDPPADIRGVDNWTGEVLTVQDSDEFFLAWDTNGKTSLLPGQTVTGFRVGMAQEDQRYLNLHWRAMLLGTQERASSLVKVVEPPAK
jgi:hypothetical protein